MTIISDLKDRYQIFQEELAKLGKAKLIKLSEYNRMMRAHQDYYRMQENKSHQPRPIEKQSTVEKSVEMVQQAPVETTKAAKVEQPVPRKTQNFKPSRPKKSSEQVRERNITWLLILGVLFLLISGLVVATSTWDQMGALLKVSTLLGVALFFLGLSAFTSKVLNIQKTAFAFLTLGSLLLPIAIIAIGYFELFGPYLSLTGDGRYWLGLICTLVPLPLYFRNAYQTKTRLFVWISFVFLSFSVGFLLAAINVPVDLFFLMMMLFNAGLLYSYHRLKKQTTKSVSLFIKELPGYIQLNLIVSTLLMLFIYDQSIFYSFNILITACLYMATVFVFRSKEYQLFFIALFAYGVFQLTENSFLQTADLLIYSLLGVAYLTFAHLMRKDAHLNKIFYYSSGFISGLAFLYITYQGLSSQIGTNSWLMLLAYLVISATYLYLAHTTKEVIFRWFTPVLFMVVGLQIWNLTVDPFFPEQLINFMFVYAVCLFIFVGFPNRFKYFKEIEKPTFYSSIGVILLTMLIDFSALLHIDLAFKLFIVGVLAIYVAFNKFAKKEKQIAYWVHSISWLFAVYAILNRVYENSAFYREYFDYPTTLAIGGLIILAISRVWKKFNQSELTKISFFTGQGSYLLALYLLLGSYSVDGNIVRPLILIFGIALSYWLVEYTKINGLWSLVALISAGFYLSLLTPFSIESTSGVLWYMLGLPILFLTIVNYLGRYKPGLKPHFFWFAHGILALLVLNLASESFSYNSQALHPIIWLVPILIYLYTTLTRTKKIAINISLYVLLSMVIAFIISLLSYYDSVLTLPYNFEWLIAILSLIGIWLGSSTIWRRRIEWYLIPLMNLILIWVSLDTRPGTFGELFSWLLLVILLLSFLHYRKWTNFNLIALLSSVAILEAQTAFMGIFYNWLIFMIGFVILIMTGRVLFEKLIKYKKQGKIVFDWYSLVSLVYLLYAYSYVGNYHHIWLEVIVLVALVSWFFLQTRRLSNQFWKNSFMTLGSLACLAPYYLIFGEYMNYIPDVIHAELRALPILVLTIFFTNKIWVQYKPIMRQIHTIVLVMITIYLVGDAIESALIWDALILGTLSILSLLIGMRYQIKAYFFVGIATLLFNLGYQTRTFWGNLPWWVYLLVVGILFITIASYNEWKKQQKEAGQFEKKFRNILNKFKEWN